MREPMSKLVREEALVAIQGPAGHSTPMLSKVVGVSDLVAWNLRGQVFDEIHPRTIKKLVANKQDATKEEVAAALPQFVGEQEYECDDESDAVAVGVAWLIQNGFIESPYKEEEPEEPAPKKRTRKKKAE